MFSDVCAGAILKVMGLDGVQRVARIACTETYCDHDHDLAGYGLTHPEAVTTYIPGVESSEDTAFKLYYVPKGHPYAGHKQVGAICLATVVPVCAGPGEDVEYVRLNVLVKEIAPMVNTQCRGNGEVLAAHALPVDIAFCNAYGKRPLCDLGQTFEVLQQSSDDLGAVKHS